MRQIIQDSKLILFYKFNQIWYRKSSRNGKITREEASYLVKKYDTEFPAKYFKEFLEYIDSTEEQFWETVNKHRSPHIWKKVDGEWKLRHTVNKDGIDD